MSEAGTPLTCEEIDELSGLYVLGALDADEQSAVAEHIATCTLSAHAAFAEVGSVVPALATAAPAAGAPAALKRRVLEGYRADTGPSSTQPTNRAARWTTPRTWLPAIATLLVLVVVGAWGIGQALEANQARDRAAALAQAIAAMSEPGSTVAVLQGSGAAAGARGFAAFPAAGGAHIVLVDMPQAPAGQAYQAWYIAAGTPTSAGLMSVGSDGQVVMSDPAPLAGTEVFAVTLEPAGGSVQPTTDPIVVGELTAPA